MLLRRSRPSPPGTWPCVHQAGRVHRMWGVGRRCGEECCGSRRGQEQVCSRPMSTRHVRTQVSEAAVHVVHAAVHVEHVAVHAALDAKSQAQIPGGSAPHGKAIRSLPPALCNSPPPLSLP
eukprot:350190-Chlamydomonas_euryale.AAC.2